MGRLGRVAANSKPPHDGEEQAKTAGRGKDGGQSCCSDCSRGEPAGWAGDFKDFGVAVLSIWMGALLIDRLNAIIESGQTKYGYLETTAETPEYTGHIVWALYNDPGFMALSGQTVIGAEMGAKYGILDEGRQPPSYRDTHNIEPRVQYPNVIR
jgi:hypothetical protein